MCYRVRNEGEEEKNDKTQICIGGRGRVQNLNANMTTKKKINTKTRKSTRLPNILILLL